MIIDTHQHFWDPSRAEYPWMTDDLDDLRRQYGPEDLEPLLEAHGVHGTVVVQARQSLDETAELLEIAQTVPFVLGVVGWVDLTGDVGRQLDALGGALVGVRHQVHDEDDPAWLLREDVQRGLFALGDAGLVYDLLVRTRELPAAIETVRRHPATTFVLDHVAKRPSDDAVWADGVAAIAKLPNVVCKLSGLLTEYDPKGTVEFALACFGSQRCMFGSDWPVCLLGGSYADALRVVGTDPEVLAETAIRTYGIETA